MDFMEGIEEGVGIEGDGQLNILEEANWLRPLGWYEFPGLIGSRMVLVLCCVLQRNHGDVRTACLLVVMFMGHSTWLFQPQAVITNHYFPWLHKTQVSVLLSN